MSVEYQLKIKYVKNESSLSSDYIKQEEETFKIYLEVGQLTVNFS
jgi:hypothetical protein